MYPLRPSCHAARGVLAACLVLLGAAVRAEPSQPWPAVAVPPHAQAEWVSDNLKVNGIPMRILHFVSTASRAEVVNFYTAHWTGGYTTAPTVRQLGEATVVGQAHGPYFMTAKIADAPQSGSQGYLAISQVLGNHPERSAGGLPLPPGATLLQVVESVDPDRRSRELTVRDGAGVASRAGWYEAALGGAGWHLVQKSLAQPGHVDAGVLEIYHREEEELSVSLLPGNGRGSQAVLNLVTKGTGRGAD